MRHARSARSSFAQPLAELVAPVLDPVLLRRGFGQRDILSHWDEIVGDRLAAVSEPIELKWPAGARRGTTGIERSATLVVRVESGFALDLQQAAGQVVDRINAYFGWRCVARLALRQGPIERRGPRRRPLPGVDPVAAVAAAHLVTDVEDDALRLALTRLGARVITRDRGARTAAPGSDA